MFKHKLENLLYFDLETTSEFETLGELKIHNERKYNVFLKHCKIQRNKGAEHYVNHSDDELYISKAPVLPEYGKIICFSSATFKSGDELVPDEIKYFSSCSDDELTIMTYIHRVLKKIDNNPRSIQLCGHNIKGFDIPWICKKLIQYKFDLPNIVCIFHKKPWEMQFVDTKELWSFGSYYQNAIVDEITTMLDIDDPKDDIDGSEVYNEYWKNHNLERIRIYCEKDVKSCIDIMKRLYSF